MSGDTDGSGRSGPRALRWLRDSTGLTQSELARRSGVSVRTIRALERGEVDRPHHGSLEAVADGAGLDGEARLVFVRAWAASPAVATYAELLDASELDAAIEAAGFTFSPGQRSLRQSRRVVIGTDRRIGADDYDLSLEATSPGVGSTVFVWNCDQASDARLASVEAIAGCAVTRSAVFAVRGVPGRVLAAQLLLDPMGVGETRSFRYRVRPLAHAGRPGLVEVRAGLRDSDGVTYGSMGPLDQLELEVHFEGAAPARVWQIRGEGGRFRRLRRVRLDTWGTVNLTLRDVEPGNHGFEWAWA